jgi:hypothetical protein
MKPLQLLSVFLSIDDENPEPLTVRKLLDFQRAAHNNCTSAYVVFF